MEDLYRRNAELLQSTGLQQKRLARRILALVRQDRLEEARQLRQAYLAEHEKLSVGIALAGVGQ